MLSCKATVKAAGLNIWATGDHNHKGPEVDIIAVQGLGAHPYYTWVKKPYLVEREETGKLSLSKILQKRRAPIPKLSDTTQTATDVPEVMWLRDLLPNSIHNARIASYSYESDWRQDVKTNLRKCGEQFLNVLHQSRASNQERQRPLIMIGHSLGGLVIKQALVLADHGENFKDIKLATFGIIFLGTPHQGSSAAEYSVWLARAIGNDTTLLESLKKNSPSLHGIAQDFEASYSNADIICFYEQKYGPAHIQFVDDVSASLNGKRRVCLNTDHSGLNKYLDSEDENFLLIQAEICRMAETAPQMIKERYHSYKSATRKDTFSVDFSLKGIPVMDKFVGRNAEITRLAQLMIPSATDKIRRKVCLIHGIGGVGKTQLAVEFVRQYHENFSAIFWIAGSTKQKLRRSIADLARRLPQDQVSEKARSILICSDEDLDAIVVDVLKWFSKPSNDQWLLIFDNVDREFSLQSNDCEAFDIKEYIPDADQGSVLITSRLAGAWHLAENGMKLEPFDEMDGEILLKSIVGQDLEDLSKLVNLLQGLPLAINQAGSYMRETGTNAFEYMELYNQTWGELMIQQHDPEAQEAPPRSILTTWTVSFKHLEEKCEGAANLLILWAFLDNQDIWYELLSAVLGLEVADKLPEWFSRCVGSKLDFKKHTRFLIYYSFVNANLESSSFSVHSVLHRWCFYNSDKKKVDMAWLAVLIVASSAPKAEAFDYTLLQRRLLPHCDRIYALLHQNILNNINAELNMSLNNACHDLGRLYKDQGKMVEAEAMYLLALAGVEKAWGPEHISALDTVNSLGILYSNQGKIAKAEAMHLRALAGYEKAWGPEHTSTLRTVNNLGIMYSDQGKMAEAEAMHLRAFAGYEKAWGPEHKSTLGALNNLGTIYRHQGKMAEAESMYLRALAGKTKSWGPEHTSTLVTVNNLGILYKNQDKMVEAEAMFLRALAGYEKAWGPEHISTLGTVNNLGILYSDQKKMAEAEAMYLRALAGKEKSWGSESSSTLDTVNNLGTLYLDQGKMAEAEAMLLRALAGYEKTWGPEHISTLRTMNNLGTLYSDQGKMAEAEAMYLRALDGKEKAWGPEHSSTLDTVNNLGTLYSDQGKMAEAEAMYLRALAGYEKAWGPEHLSTLNTRYNLALLYKENFSFKDAAEHFQLVVEGFTRLLGPDHSDTVDAAYELESCGTRSRNENPGNNIMSDVDGNDHDDNSDRDSD